jgi:hypothetical protein
VSAPSITKDRNPSMRTSLGCRNVKTSVYGVEGAL